MALRFAVVQRSRPRAGIPIVTAACVVAAFSAMPLVLGPSVTAGAQGASSNWSQYLNGPAHSSYDAAATSITPSAVTAGNLEPVWQFNVPYDGEMSNGLLGSPTVVDGVVYIGSLNGYFYALDPASHSVLWSDDLGVMDDPGAGCSGLGIESTAAVVTDPDTGLLTVYVNAPDGNLYALNAATGAVVWQATVDTPDSVTNDYYAWGSPLVVNDMVYIGISSCDDQPLIPGALAAFNQTTGSEVAVFDTLPAGDLGASIWSSAAALSDGSIIATTGNGPAGPQPLYNQSILRLDGSTLSLLDSWQVPLPEQVTDGDFGGSPTLFTADIDGVDTPMLGACNKDGVYYALAQDDLSAGPVWKDRITVPYTSAGNAGDEECDAAAIWNGKFLIEGGGAPTTVDGTTYLGSVRALKASNGAVLWQRGLPGTVVGSPTEDGSGVVAAQVFQADTANDMGVYLLDASNGKIIGHITTPDSAMFAQPVFVGDDLLIAGSDGALVDYEVTTPGAPITKVTPSTIEAGTDRTVTLTGKGFSGSPQVVVSGSFVGTSSVVLHSSTSLSVEIEAGAKMVPGTYDITVAQPGSPQVVTSTCEGCLTVTAASSASS